MGRSLSNVIWKSMAHRGSCGLIVAETAKPALIEISIGGTVSASARWLGTNPRMAGLHQEGIVQRGSEQPPGTKTIYLHHPL